MKEFKRIQMISSFQHFIELRLNFFIYLCTQRNLWFHAEPHFSLFSFVIECILVNGSHIIVSTSHITPQLFLVRSILSFHDLFIQIFVERPNLLDFVSR
jgi:regulator of sigma D